MLCLRGVPASHDAAGVVVPIWSGGSVVRGGKVVKVWEVTSLGDGDDHSYTEGLCSTLDKAKASVSGAEWEQPQRGPGYLFAQVTHGSGYYDDGEYWVSFTHYYIRERKVL